MAKRKLKLESFKRLAVDSPECRNCVLLIFNRDLHPLEAMGIAHLVATDIDRIDS